MIVENWAVSLLFLCTYPSQSTNVSIHTSSIYLLSFLLHPQQQSPSAMSSPLKHVNPSKLVSLNDRIAIFWPIEKQFFRGIVTNLEYDGKAIIHYEDGDVETLDLAGEIWKFLPLSKPVSQMIKPVPCPLPATAPDAAAAPTSMTAEQPVKTNQSHVQLQPPVHDGKSMVVCFGRPPKPDNFGKSSKPAPASATAIKTSIRKRTAPASFKKRAAKKPTSGTCVAMASTSDISNAAPKESPSTPPAVTVAVAPIVPVFTGTTEKQPATRSVGEPSVPIIVTYLAEQGQLDRPINSGVPLCSVTPPRAGLIVLPSVPSQELVPQPYEASASVQDALQPLTTSFNAQLNTNLTQSSTLRDMLLSLSPVYRSSMSSARSSVPVSTTNRKSHREPRCTRSSIALL